MLRDGMFGPGTKLKLRELALEFGTSLTPVRDALSRLVAEQVLESSLNRTVIVPIPWLRMFARCGGSAWSWKVLPPARR